MSYKPEEGKGSIFKNDYKKEDKHPDYKGDAMVDGKMRDIALWLSKTKEGKPFFSVRVSEKREQPSREPGSDDDFGDDVPF